MLGSDSQRLLPSTFPKKCTLSSLLCGCESCSHKVRRKQSSICQITMSLTCRQEDSDKSTFNVCTQIAKCEHTTCSRALWWTLLWECTINIPTAFTHSSTRSPSRRYLQNETPEEQQSFSSPITVLTTSTGAFVHGVVVGHEEKGGEVRRGSAGTWGWMRIG